MYGPRTENKTKKILVRIGIALGVISCIGMLAAVGILIFKVTGDNNQVSSVASNNNQNATSNGLSLGEASSTATNNDIALQGLTSSSGSSNSTSKANSSLPAPNAAPTSQDPKPVRTQTLPNGLKIDEYVYGTGDKATKFGDTIAVQYVGYLTDGTVFDTSLKGTKQPFAFKLGAGQVIQGWDIGLQDMHVNAVRRLMIPASLAYGSKGYPPSIPANATLIFDVQLVGIQ